jgi:predicted enzyme related to lactoylglutathione lyase
MMARPPMAPAAALNSYFEVKTIDGTLPKVIEAGGMVIVPKTEIPGVGWFAMFVDLDRIPIGIFETRAQVPPAV